jgi:hypothetical protein
MGRIRSIYAVWAYNPRMVDRVRFYDSGSHRSLRFGLGGANSQSRRDLADEGCGVEE